MSPVSKLLLLRPALLQVPATLSRTVRPLSSQPLTRAMLLRAPPVASVVVGTATAIVTEKIASKLVDKVADEAATKAVETAKTAVAAMTGLDLDTESEGKDGKDEDGSAGSKTRSASATTSATNSSAPMGQRRAISTRTSINVTPQKNQQPYDYKPISDIDSIADAIGPEYTRDALNDAHGAAAESSTKAATERHLKAASTNPTGTEESQQLKETVKGFVGSVAADGKDMWKDTKNEFGEAVEITKDTIHDTAQSIKGTVGKVLGAGMGDATKVAENSQSMFTTGADIVGNKADDAKDTAAAATSTAHDAYAAVKDKAQDSSSTAADKITDSYTSAKDKAQDIYVSAADRAKATANKAEDMYSHAADRAEDAVLASRAKAARVAQDALGTAAGMADSARAMGHEAVDKTKAKAGQVKEKVMDATHNMTGQAKVAADQIEGKYHEAKAGAMGAAAGYAAGTAGRSAIERAKETAMGGGGGSAPGAMAGMDDLPVGHTMNDYLDEVEDRIRGGDVRGRRSKL